MPVSLEQPVRLCNRSHPISTLSPIAWGLQLVKVSSRALPSSYISGYSPPV